MKYDVISADGHVDLIWLPPDLFTANASSALKGSHAPRGRGTEGAGMGERQGREVRPNERHGLGRPRICPGVIHRSDRMASTGLFEDGKKGIRRLTEPGCG